MAESLPNLSMEWRVYYGDGATFSSEDGPPESAPALNMQVIVQRTLKEGRIMLSGQDYYWWDVGMGEWCGGDLFGLYDHLIHTGGHGFGRTIAQTEYDAIKRRASKDPDLPAQSMRNQEREGRLDG